MSMLTPPGMGGKYRVTGKKYPKMYRPKGRRRLVLRVIAGTSALGLAAWGSVQLIDVFSKDGEKQTVQASSASAGDCKPAASAKDSGGVKTPEPATITVNVYNATDRTGLAKDTAEKLKKRGFKIGEVDNAPEELDKKVKIPGLLLGTPEAKRDGSLAVLGAHLTGTDAKTDKTRKGEAAESVDLVLGTGYKALAKPVKAAQVISALNKPTPSPAPGNC